MKTIALGILVVIIGCTAAKQAKQEPENSWLNTFIAAQQQAPPANPPITITAYQYQGDTVYYVTAPCCDQFTTLYDKAGNQICHPDGGITGKGDGLCPDFRTAAVELYTVWKDDRNSLK